MAGVFNCSLADFAYVENWEFRFLCMILVAFLLVCSINVLLLYIYISYFSLFNFLIKLIFFFFSLQIFQHAMSLLCQSCLMPRFVIVVCAFLTFQCNYYLFIIHSNDLRAPSTSDVKFVLL